jgi:hypothetical protein
MLEILLIRLLCSRISDMAERRGLPGTVLCILFVLGWFGVELVAGALGFLLTKGSLVAGYLLALVGVVVYALFFNLFVALLPGEPARRSLKEIEQDALREARRKKKRPSRRYDEEEEDRHSDEEERPRRRTVRSRDEEEEEEERPRRRYIQRRSDED